MEELKWTSSAVHERASVCVGGGGFVCKRDAGPVV